MSECTYCHTARSPAPTAKASHTALLDGTSSQSTGRGAPCTQARLPARAKPPARCTQRTYSWARGIYCALRLLHALLLAPACSKFKPSVEEATLPSGDKDADGEGQDK